ncbi:putative 11-beta-hydroxysteroid dehydrogenase [Helianthus debilis subsp. tardiflorus]
MQCNAIPSPPPNLNFTLISAAFATTISFFFLKHKQTVAMMDLVNSFLNLAAPPFTFFTMLLFLPPWIFFKFCTRILRTLFSEVVSGKVVLITGASSGIGEVPF